MTTITSPCQKSSHAAASVGRKGEDMQSKNVRQIKQAISLQAMRGTRRVSLADGYRVIDARTVKGQLQVRLLGWDKWQAVDYVNID
jgi:hypothetical protein